MFYHRPFKWLATFVVLVFVFMALTYSATAASPGAVKSDLKFVTYIQAHLPEQDVFVERNDIAPDLVVRIEGNDATDPSNLSKMLYATASETAHDPTKAGATPLGPFAKGKALGFSLQQWLAAAGSGTYTVEGGNAELNLSFRNLVPNSVYTVWCSRINTVPTRQVVDRPCGATDGSQNASKSDAQGNGTFNLKLSALEDTTKIATSVIALAYHDDGITYGNKPGEFGSKTHVQLFAPIPAPAAPATLPQTGVANDGASGVWLALISGALLIAGAWLLAQMSRRTR